MEILDNIKIIDLGLFLKKEKILIIADTHIGYDEALNKQGMLVPRQSFKDLLKRIEKILYKTGNLSKIIINGDIKHEFGTISDEEWRNTLRLIDYLQKFSKEIILIKGNHDKILGPIADKRPVIVKKHLIINNTLIIHGDVIPCKDILKKVKTIIIGHEHPAITLKDLSRIEKFKCFLKGKYKRKNLIVQPSFNLLREGTDISKDKLLSPYLHQNLNNFELFIVSDKVYNFGKLKKLIID